MRYVSTRGGAPEVGFFDAVLAGLAPDGGLYIPQSWPREFDRDDFRRTAGLAGFTFVASHVLKAFAGEDLTQEECSKLVVDAYLGDLEAERYKPPFADFSITPLRQEGPGGWIMELFHGPSLAFKDIAMQLIGPLYDLALARRDKRLTVLCATSGDTGGAAVEALKNRERIDVFVLTPKGRVSEVQRRFMTTSEAANVFALEIDADFDTCQALLKQLFADAEFAARAQLSAVNSINWARIIAQSVYFHVAANALAAPGPVHFSIPSGNFGDGFSGLVAKKMGAPIGKMIVAVNANDILARALSSGRYERAPASHATLSPAMDIQVASNFERLTFESLGRDPERTRALYESFAQSGAFDIPADALAAMRKDFAGASVSDEETREAMRNYAEAAQGALICPHTAVAWQAIAKLADDDAPEGPLVTLATAHPAKFPETVEAATGVRPMLPFRAADLFIREEKYDALPPDLAQLKAFISERSRAWS